MRLESCNTKHGRQQKGVAKISMVPEDGTGCLDFKRIAHRTCADSNITGRRLLFESLVGLQPSAGGFHIGHESPIGRQDSPPQRTLSSQSKTPVRGHLALHQ